MNKDFVACPFCHEMFSPEERTTCPHCGLELRPLNRLPPSYEVRMEEKAAQMAVPAHWRPLPWLYWRRGRGALVLASIIGICVFFLPWVHVTTPEIVTLSGFDMARASGWIWSYFVAWAIMIPSVVSRRNVMQMRGARVATTMFTMIPLMTIAILSYKVPKGGFIPVRFTFEASFYVAGVVALVALPFGVLFGGKRDYEPASYDD